MIDKIPTSKEELFAYPIDASLVDSVSMRGKSAGVRVRGRRVSVREDEIRLRHFKCKK